MIRLAEQLKVLRQKEGLSQEELGKQLFISRQAISKWETGETVPDLEHLVKLSEIFDVSLDYLVLGEEQEVIVEDTDDFMDYPEKSSNLWEFLENNWWILVALFPWILLIVREIF